MNKKDQKIKSLILFSLIIVGIYFTYNAYESIIHINFYLSVIYIAIVLFIAFYTTRLFYEFRYMYRLLKVRGEIIKILLKLKINKKEANILAENLVLKKTDVKSWDEIPKDIRHEIKLSLENLNRYKYGDTLLKRIINRNLKRY
ncbi:MAG: hypothetical protein ACYDAS_03600 [Patescibacteria group bacterium]